MARVGEQSGEGGKAARAMREMGEEKSERPRVRCKSPRSPTPGTAGSLFPLQRQPRCPQVHRPLRRRAKHHIDARPFFVNYHGRALHVNECVEDVNLDV
jgi:hypothetical protein